ncbi:MAG: rubredoxin [Clostridia bacterium]|nr:rubredoxin [Clostridia bacterium]
MKYGETAFDVLYLLFAIISGVALEDLPDDWKCPRCKQPKEKFNRA